MRKGLISAIAVEAAVLVVALVLSVAAVRFGEGGRDLVANIAMIVALVLVSSVLLFVYRLRMRQRDEMTRRFYVSRDWIYNHEIGHAPMERVLASGDAYGFVTFAADALAKMSYGFEVADAPADFSPEFVIDSRVFQFHSIGGADDDPADGVVVDRWCGALQRVSVGAGGRLSLADVGEFENAAQLAQLIDEHMDFVPDFVGGGF